jgi:F420-non-reducing hydrogenase iron-sulfur subunit
LVAERRKILILATATCAYPAADTTGQAHLHYPASTYILRVPSPVLFPDDFYYRCFEKGIGGILVMSCGHECPYLGAFSRLTARIDRVKLGLKERGIDPGRVRLSAICTVCTKSFLNEIAEMEKLLASTTEAAGAAATGTGAAAVAGTGIAGMGVSGKPLSGGSPS